MKLVGVLQEEKKKEKDRSTATQFQPFLLLQLLG